MKSTAAVAGHPLHPLLVTLPVGLLVSSLIFDIVFFAAGGAGWAFLAIWAIVFGLGFALIAAIAGIIDYLSLSLDRRAWTIATYHLVLNLTLIALFVASLGWRLAANDGIDMTNQFTPVGPFILSIIGIGVLLASGWLGGELVFRHRIGVIEPADRFAP